MGTVPTFPSFAAGEIPTAAKLNLMKAAVDFTQTPPQCYAHQASATTTLTNNVYTLVSLDGELFDIVQSGDSPSHDLVTTNSRIYVRTAGKYEISGQLMFAANTTGARNGNIRMNAAGVNTGGSSLYTGTTTPVTGTVTALPLPQLVLPFLAGDYIELFGFQNSGGGLATVAGQGNTFLRMRWVGA